MEKKEILRQTSLFANISAHSTNALSDICIPKTLNKKEILFLEGDKGYSLYILVSGNIQLYKASPDVLCISGSAAGQSVGTDLLKEVKNAVPNEIIFSNTGCTKENIVEKLKICDGAVVATTFKFDGNLYNPVDISRVKEFMKKVHQYREML